MNKLYFLDISSGKNHKSITGEACGASEYQFYTLIKKLSLKYECLCFHNTKRPKTIDGISYFPIKELKNVNNEKILLLRFIPSKKSELYCTLRNNNIFLYCQDINFDKVYNWADNDNSEEDLHEINPFLVCVSNYHKDVFVSSSTKKLNIITIYNSLINEEFSKRRIEKDPFLITYASAWSKGIKLVLEKCEEIYRKDRRYKLNILSPGYADNNQIDLPDNTTIVGRMDKEKYSELIMKSLCVIMPKFNESCGVVAIESNYLGTPVICDHKSGAVPEIINSNFAINYEDEMFETVEKIRNSQKTCSSIVDERFNLERNVKKWEELLTSR